MLVSNTLPTTKTREDWSFAYLPSADPSALADGSLTVTEHSGKRVRRSISCRYAVSEQPARGCRCFLLVLESRTGDEETAAGREAATRIGEVYETRLFTSGRFACSCKAGQTGRECKHGLALRSLVATAELPSPLLNGDADYGDTERQCPGQNSK